jgi:hypothetical protein
MAGAFDDFDPTGAKQKNQPVAAPPPPQPSGGAFSDFNPTGAKPVAAPPPPVVQPPPGASGASQPAADWSIDWSKGGEVKLPQSVQDWSTLAAQNSWMGLPGAPGKAQADAARARLDPLTAASADVAGGAISPTTLLNAVPGVGPELAGGLHEGIKSAVENWTPDQSWPTYLKNVGEDAAGGVAAGFGGQMTGLAAQKALPELIKTGVVTGGAAIGHKLLGGGAIPDFGKELPALFGIYKGMDKVADWAGETGKDLISSPAAQQAIKNLILGGGSAARQYAGPYDQWMGN